MCSVPDIRPDAVVCPSAVICKGPKAARDHSETADLSAVQPRANAAAHQRKEQNKLTHRGLVGGAGAEGSPQEGDVVQLVGGDLNGQGLDRRRQVGTVGAGRRVVDAPTVLERDAVTLRTRSSVVGII